MPLDYRVKAGQDYVDIAANTGTSPLALMKRNRFNQLNTGQTIELDTGSGAHENAFNTDLFEPGPTPVEPATRRPRQQAEENPFVNAPGTYYSAGTYAGQNTGGTDYGQNLIDFIKQPWYVRNAQYVQGGGNWSALGYEPTYGNYTLSRPYTPEANSYLGTYIDPETGQSVQVQPHSDPETTMPYNPNLIGRPDNGTYDTRNPVMTQFDTGGDRTGANAPGIQYTYRPGMFNEMYTDPFWSNYSLNGPGEFPEADEYAGAYVEQFVNQMANVLTDEGFNPDNMPNIPSAMLNVFDIMELDPSFFADNPELLTLGDQRAAAEAWFEANGYVLADNGTHMYYDPQFGETAGVDSGYSGGGGGGGGGYRRYRGGGGGGYGSGGYGRGSYGSALGGLVNWRGVGFA